MNQRIASAFSTFMLVISPLCGAQEVIRLHCKGELQSTSDYLGKESKATSVDVAIDLRKKTMTVDGWWGCLANLGEVRTEATKCGPSLPVEVSDSNVEYFDQSAGEQYQGGTMAKINRFSGKMAVFSNATARPPAKWTHMTIAGDLDCTPSKQLF